MSNSVKCCVLMACLGLLLGADKPAARRTEDVLRYSRNILLAEREWLDRNPVRARSVLDSCPEKDRGWEWSFLAGRLPRTPHFALLGKQQKPVAVSGAYRAVALSADGRLLAATGTRPLLTKAARYFVGAWDVETRANLMTVDLPPYSRLFGTSAALGFSADGRCLAVAFVDSKLMSRVLVLEVRSGKTVATVLSKDGVTAVALAPDGTRLAVGRDNGTVEIAPIGKKGSPVILRQGHQKPISQLAFSPDGKRLISADQEGTLRVIDAGSGKPVARVMGHDRPVLSVRYRPDGKQAASADADGTVQVWDADTGKVRLRLLQAGKLLAFSPDSRRLAAAVRTDGDDTVTVRDVDTGRTIASIRANVTPLAAIAFVGDGKRLAALTAKGDVFTWSAFQGQGEWNLDTGKSPTTAVAFLPTGERLVSASQDGIVTVVNSITGQIEKTIPGAGDLLALSPDGTRLAVASSKGGPAQVIDPESGKVVLTLPVAHRRTVRGVAASPDGKWFASAGYDGFVFVWDARTAQQRHRLRVESWYAGGVAFSPDKKLLATAGWQVKLWDLSTGRLVRTLEGKKVGWQVRSVSFNRDGKLLASAQEDRVTIWDTTTGKVARILKGHARQVNSVAFSPDGKRLASCSGIKEEVKPGEIKVWDAATGKTLLTLGKGVSSFQSVAFSPDGKRLLTAGDDGLTRLWDLENAKELLPALQANKQKSINWALSVAFSPDGKFMASSGDRNITVWETDSRRKVCALEGHRGLIESLAFSADSKRLISGGRDSQVLVWELPGGKAGLPLFGHSGAIQGVAISSDRKAPWLATVASDSTLRIWDARTAKQLRVLPGAISCVCFDPAGERLATAGPDNSVLVWKAGTGERLHVLRGHTRSVVAVAFSPDGKRLASGGFDQTVRVWDLTTGKAVLTAQGHTGAVQSLAYSPDGKRLFSGGEDGKVKLWDVDSGEEMFTLRGAEGPIRGLALGALGKRVAAATGSAASGSVMVWEPVAGR